MEQLLTQAPPQPEFKRNSHGAAQGLELPAAKIAALPRATACPGVSRVPSLALLLIHLQRGFDASLVRSFTSQCRSKTPQWDSGTAFSMFLPHSPGFFLILFSSPAGPPQCLSGSVPKTCGCGTCGSVVAIVVGWWLDLVLRIFSHLNYLVILWSRSL